MSGIARQVLKRLLEARTLAGEVLPEGFVLPAYGGYSLANVPATVLDHFGISGVCTPPLAAEVVGDQLEGARKLIVLLVDALGYPAVKAQMAEDRSLGLNDLARKGRFVPLTSVFPSTTAVTLSTLHTGLPPVGHAITGYRMYLPERGVVANMIRLSPDMDERSNRLLRHPGDAGALLGVPTVHRRLTRAGVASYCLIRKGIYGSGLSEMLYADATERIPFVNVSDMFVQIRKLVEADPGAPACIWAYWGALDEVLHDYGTRGGEAEAEVRNLSYSLRRELLEPLRRSRTGRVALMLTSDHGQIQVDAGGVIPLRRFRRLREALIAPPTGTGRSAYLHLGSGDATAVREAVRKALGGRAMVLTSRDALDDGLWGTGRVRPEICGRIGDLLVLLCGARALFYPYRKGASRSELVGGRHGGLHEKEMLIPFFCAGL